MMTLASLGPPQRAGYLMLAGVLWMALMIGALTSSTVQLDYVATLRAGDAKFRELRIGELRQGELPRNPRMRTSTLRSSKKLRHLCSFRYNNRNRSGGERARERRRWHVRRRKQGSSAPFLGSAG